MFFPDPNNLIVFTFIFLGTGGFFDIGCFVFDLRQDLGTGLLETGDVLALI